MGFRTTNLQSFEKFTLPTDTVEPKTIWIIGPIDGALMAAIDDGTTLYKVDRSQPESDAGMTVRLNKRFVEAVRYGLKGWENLQDSTGQQLKYESQEYAVDGVGPRPGVKDALLRSIALKAIAVIGARILELNDLPGDARKN